MNLVIVKFKDFTWIILFEFEIHEFEWTIIFLLRNILVIGDFQWLLTTFPKVKYLLSKQSSQRLQKNSEKIFETRKMTIFVSFGRRSHLTLKGIFFACLELQSYLIKADPFFFFLVFSVIYRRFCANWRQLKSSFEIHTILYWKWRWFSQFSLFVYG